MPFIDDDSNTVRKYLLGQLTDGEQQNLEQRFLTEDELNQELEVTTEELVDEYLAQQLTKGEAKWFEEHFLASPQGKQSQKFARTFQRYFSSKERTERSWSEQLWAFWNRQAMPLRAVAGLAIVVIVVGVFWFSRTPAPRSLATITLTNLPITRSGGDEVARIKFKEDALRVNLVLPGTAAPGVRYQAELIDGSARTRTLEPIKQDAASVAVEIPASLLAPGQYAITLTSIASDNAAQRIPGNYQFIIE